MCWNNLCVLCQWVCGAAWDLQTREEEPRCPAHPNQTDVDAHHPGDPHRLVTKETGCHGDESSDKKVRRCERGGSWCCNGEVLSRWDHLKHDIWTLTHTHVHTNLMKLWGCFVRSFSPWHLHNFLHTVLHCNVSHFTVQHYTHQSCWLRSSKKSWSWLVHTA